MMRALTVTATARKGGQTFAVDPETPDGNNSRRYKITDAGKTPTVALGDVCAQADGWQDLPASGQVTGAAGQVATVVECTNSGAQARAVGSVTLPAPTPASVGTV